jgi:hypothetical protein
LTQMKNETFSVIQDKLKSYGYYSEEDSPDDYDYVCWKKPPEHFKRPYLKVEQYENVVTFRNGFTIVFMATKDINSKRGGNFDCGIIDEAAFVKRAAFERVLSQMVRANTHRFDSPFHHQKILISSRPRSYEGSWVSDMEEKAAASEDIFYMEASALDNKDALPEGYFDEQLELLGYLEYLIEIENQKVDRLPDGFYHQFRNELHTYTPQYLWQNGERYDTRYNPDALLELSFDFGGWFSCCSIFQERDKTEWLLRQCYVDTNERIAQLVDKICDQYPNHNMKLVRLYGDPTGRNKNPSDIKDLYEQMAERFVARGWSVQIKAKAGAPSGHKERYEYMNNVLAEDAALPRLRINASDAKDIIVAVNLCDRTSSFKKNKTAEENKRSPQIHAPHFTDTVDYYFEQKHGIKSSRRNRRRKSVA